MKSPRFVSLFSGCGGFDLGFVRAGFDPVAAFDNWAAAVDNYRLNIGGEAVVRDLSSGEVPYDGPCDVLLSGSPCQGFSTVGKRDVADPRNALLTAAVSAAAKLRPKVVVIENVPGVRFGAHKEYWIRAIRGLEALGYCVQQVALDAADYGIPQARRRVMLVAFKARVAPVLSFDALKPVKLSDVLQGLKGIANHSPKLLGEDSPDARIARRIGLGQKLCDVRGGAASVHTWQIPEVFGPISEAEREFLEALLVLRRRDRVRSFGDADPVRLNVISEFLKIRESRATTLFRSLEKKSYVRERDGRVDMRYGFNGKYRRLSPDAASCTVHTQFGNPQYFLHPFENRGFTVREAARIQSFPDSYVFSGSARDQYKMIGNAVPPALGFAVAMALRNSVKGWRI
ncbi:DNA cytosine methyltransferase|uniref:DNA cytosine methyltransferase n=1 Tax=Stenotrophomonas sp. SbOxS2 TaxID=2723885 RepID=UPI0015D3B429|nr:DNA cytosine methyltransferase [Stenotrophomonas sp. SbOxS2]NYU00880.1 DNA cytosine methyltransferase [Stenotrophomonas sp. SbOxS2]